MWNLRGWLAAALCLLAVSAGSSVQAANTPNTPVGGDFTLTSASGSPFSLHDARGKVVLMVFGYTSCPDICPTMLLKLQVVLKQLGKHARDVQALFVSVDPGRDTPEVLRKYVAYFDPSIIALTGSPQRLTEITHHYHTFYRYRGDTTSNNYEVDHGTNLYVIDQHGLLAQIIPFGTPVENIVASVESLLPG